MKRFGLSIKDKFKLELLVKMFNNLPHQLQFADKYLYDLLINKQPRPRIDDAVIYSVTKEKLFQLGGSSMGETIIFDIKNSKNLHALIFSETFLKAMRRSWPLLMPSSIFPICSSRSMVSSGTPCL